MQNRHLDRRSYFNELATTSESYYIPYLEKHIPLAPGTKVLEIGCGEGGNLEPFAERGCEVTGVDIVRQRTEQAKTFLPRTVFKALSSVRMQVLWAKIFPASLILSSRTTL